ncbi:hypothetical protein AS850_02750 [Frondihabitans sp. 762G35]|uniref:hypothetical protein n=1 Tax=Frondihabitans sp. 762G35 TaxID=1446794 RepID=UPI000D22A88E|nr:hypothetical protein [Frondihabitans sp. 762G35]ARC55992.1 hypothetical protein AS850_02750 [Frondihabitans sp. 762G35]
MTMVARFRVASRATGIRRQVFVHVYDDRQEMARAHTEARKMKYDPTANIGGGLAVQQGYRWPRPDVTPIVVMRLWVGQLTTSTVAHEAVHAATTFFFMDCVPGWDSRARSVLLGDDEPLAYLVGDIASAVIAKLYENRLL